MRLQLAAILAFMFLPSLPSADTFRWVTSQYMGQNLSDPHRWEYDSDWSLGRQIYEPLVLKGSGETFIPVLAESLSFQDQNTVDVYIKNGVRFHEGQDLDASDVVFSILRAKSEASTVRRYASVVDSVEAIDGQTIRIEYSGSRSDLLIALSRVMIIDDRWSMEHGNDEPGESSYPANGTGAFWHESFEPGVRHTFRKSDTYRENLTHQFGLVEVVIANDSAVALHLAIADRFDFVDNISAKLEHEAERHSHLDVHRFQTDYYFTAEATTISSDNSTQGRSLPFAPFRKMVSSVTSQLDGGLLKGRPVTELSINGSVRDNFDPNRFPDIVYIYCQYHDGPFANLCQSVSSELSQNSIRNQIIDRYDNSSGSDIALRWRKLADLSLPGSAQTRAGSVNLTSLPLIADFKTIVLNRETNIRFGSTGVPLLSPYADTAQNDDECDECPPSGACSQSIVLSRQECCPPSGACSQ